MADYCVLPSCAKLQLRRIMPRGNLPMTSNFSARNRQRECLIFVKSLHTSCFSFSRFRVVQAPFLICANESRGLNENFSKCYCWGMLFDPENAAPSNLASAMDELLLMVSVILAYMAGAVPQRKKLDFMSHHTKDNPGSSSPTTHGRSERSESLTSLKTNAIWHEVNGKLLDALEATGNGANLDDLAAGITDFSRKDALSLFALNHGSTWRLLWSTLMRLQKEVSDIHSSREAFNGGAWLAGVSEIFKEIVIQILFKWLEQELSLGAAGYNMKFSQNPVIQLTEKLKGNDVILNNIKRSGKTEIYADLIFFLKFDSLRSGCCFDKNFLVEHGVEVLEDLVITLADAVASIYLELISVDSDLSIEINSLGSRICPLSTRALQRLRNEVLLKQWLQQNFESVVSLYEDRFELFVLSRLKMGEELENQTKTSIWKKLAFSKRAISSASNCVQIKTISLTVKRTKELQALTGCLGCRRYYFSLFLEFSDVAMPLVKAVFEKARSAVSFFLMCMIGRSLGLVFSGIRQSLGWK
ncbi:uncharacterized protein LOC110027006 isoform X2 [Phalaenopsis equestris]|uniref:uncharacterized protein LOC110027006 isoform X2 n=1 Tax=Phalaenopsis equestris TaxID=78828 RepID=UPI0009E5885B|nr:uncharacterized protein LOC110027006 isoform X2 [Phalaenopsis equestris]